MLPGKLSKMLMKRQMATKQMALCYVQFRNLEL
jgi:hypothetical protein